MSEDRKTSKGITLKWISKYGALSVCYIAFIASAAIFTKNRIKYHRVQSWPSVPANILKSSRSSYTIRSESRYGSGTTSFGTDEVVFEYEVKGLKLQKQHNITQRRRTTACCNVQRRIARWQTDHLDQSIPRT